ncbi:MAG: excinuclease ABC subunit A [Paracoccaceae bacterium]
MRALTIPLAVFALGLGSASVMADSFRSCPPGLAKKSPACVPPGQAKKWRGHREDGGDDHRYGRDSYRDDDHRWDPQHGYYRRGERVDDHYVFINDPWRYGLDRHYRYYRRDGYILRVDPDTQKVLDLIGAVSAFLD